MSKKKKNQLQIIDSAIEFQPDAIELEHRKLPWWANSGVLWLFAFMVGCIVWASVCKVDVIVRCTGKVVSTDPTITMTPMDRMVIDKVLVREGDKVKKGEVLFQFDPTINEADYVNYSEMLAKLQPTYDRLLAEFNGNDYVVTNPKDRNQQIQKVLFDQRKKSYESEVEYYEAAINVTLAQINSVKDQIVTYTNLVNEFEKTLSAYKELVDKRAAASLDLIEVQMNMMSYEGTLTQYKNSLPSYDSQLASNKAQLQAYKETWREQVANEFNQAEQQLTEYKQAMAKIKRYRSYYELIAPCDAMVQEVAKYSKGSAVPEAEPLITLVPVDTKYYVEVEIPAKDISKVKLGQTVRVKLTPYPFQVWGTMKGNLTHISEEAFTRQQNQSMEVAMTGSTYYRGQVEIISAFTNEPDNFVMKPGMEAVGEVITGDRRIISYILHPLIKMLDESIREP